MVDVQVLADSKQGVRLLSLMVALNSVADSSHRAPTRALYQEAKDQGKDRSGLTSDFRALGERGWLWFDEASSGIDDVVLTQSGIDAVEEFESLRTSPQKRNMAARDRLLHWLYDAYVSDASPTGVDEFIEHDTANFYGFPFTNIEVERAAAWLYREEHISGIETSGAEIVRPEITTKGSRVVESGASVNAPEGNGGTTLHTNNIEIHDSHSLNLVTGSSHVTQSNTVSIEQRTKTSEFIGSTRDLLPMLGLTGEQQALVGQIVDELEVETSSVAPQQSKMKELANKALEIVVTGTASGMVNALVAMGNGVILGLG